FTAYLGKNLIEGRTGKRLAENVAKLRKLFGIQDIVNGRDLLQCIHSSPPWCGKATQRHKDTKAQRKAASKNFICGLSLCLCVFVSLCCLVTAFVFQHTVICFTISAQCVLRFFCSRRFCSRHHYCMPCWSLNMRISLA